MNSLVRNLKIIHRNKGICQELCCDHAHAAIQAISARLDFGGFRSGNGWKGSVKKMKRRDSDGSIINIIININVIFFALGSKDPEG